MNKFNLRVFLSEICQKNKDLKYKIMKKNYYQKIKQFQITKY